VRSFCLVHLHVSIRLLCRLPTGVDLIYIFTRSLNGKIEDNEAIERKFSSQLFVISNSHDGQNHLQLIHNKTGRSEREKKT
jgi:hypothetical protein